jgi:hypothetical protein
VTQLGAVRASTAKALSRQISTSALALSRAFARAHEFSLESATKARHRGDHRRHGVSRHASLAQRVRAAPKPSRELIRSRAFSFRVRSTPRDGADSDPRGRDGVAARAHASRIKASCVAIMRNFECHIGPSIVHWRGRMSFYSNPSQNLAIAATRRRHGISRHGSLAQRVRVRAKSIKRVDAITSFPFVSAARHREARDGVDSDPRGRDGVSARAHANRVKASCVAITQI